MSESRLKPWNPFSIVDWCFIPNNKKYFVRISSVNNGLPVWMKSFGKSRDRGKSLPCSLPRAVGTQDSRIPQVMWPLIIRKSGSIMKSHNDRTRTDVGIYWVNHSCFYRHEWLVKINTALVGRRKSWRLDVKVGGSSLPIAGQLPAGCGPLRQKWCALLSHYEKGSENKI